MRSRTRARWAAASSMLFILAACGGDDGDTEQDPAPAATDQPTSLTAAGGNPSTFNYVESDDLTALVLLMHNVIEPLFERLEDGSLQPLLAESFEVSEDGREYTFTIRQAAFHDGSELTADDVVYSLELYREAPNATLSTSLEVVESVEKVDERTVHVTLSKPSQQFLQALSQDAGMIIPEDGVDELAQSPTGTGPFEFSEWRRDVEVVFSRFDNYWGELPFFEDITWRFFDDQNAQMNAAQAGELDVTGQMPATDRLESIDASPDLNIVEQSGQEIRYVSLNAEDDVFADERVRQAIAHAINREEIMAGADLGYGQTTCVLVNPPDVAWSSDYCPYPYDPGLARQLLADADVEDLTLEVKHITAPTFTTIVEILTAQLAEVGITVDPQPRDFPTYLEEVLNAESPAYQITPLAGSQQIDQWTCPGWFTKDCVQDMDNLLAQADASTAEEEWADLRRQAVELQADRAFLIPLYNTSLLHIVRDNLDGFKPYRSYVEVDLRNLRWKE